MKSPLDGRIDKWIPTPDDLDKIERLSGFGLSIKKIAPLINVHSRTLERNYEDKEGLVAVAFNKGRSKSEANVSTTAYKMATSGKSATMTQFWLRTQAGWDESGGDEQFDDLPYDPSLD